MPEHDSITDPEIHEPKGASTASAGQVYIADGAGSGDWDEYLPLGWGLYHDSSGVQALSTTATKITIDGLGADNDESHLPTAIRGVDSLWNSTTNIVEPIATGDSYLLMIDFEVQAESTASYIILEVDQSAGGSPTDIVTSMAIPLTGLSVPYPNSFHLGVVISATAFTNGLQLFMKSDAGTPAVDEVKLTITRTYSGDL